MNELTSAGRVIGLSAADDVRSALLSRLQSVARCFPADEKLSRVVRHDFSVQQFYAKSLVRVAFDLVRFT